MPSSVEQSARRETLVRQAARRQAVDVLRIAGATAEYASRVIANGLSPEQARRAALDAAGELELIAGTLRRLARLTPPERRQLAVELAADGMSHREIARRIDVSKRRTWDYLAGRP